MVQKIIGGLTDGVTRRGGASRQDRGVTILALAGHFLIIVKFEDHDIRVPIFGTAGSAELAPHPYLRESHNEPTRPSEASAGAAVRVGQPPARVG